ncbi:MAG TPA: L,D-transpeptidase [Ferruginibacter sp.]|jgi:murein L,D-transpeptidase YafK|nr:L,D-transpeptidase [Ferruginibacter sp.]
MKNNRFAYLFVFIISFLLLSFVSTNDRRKVSIKKIVPIDTTGNPYLIIIYKASYELQVFDSAGWLATYPVVFGSKDLTDKKMKGDRLTPDGNFKVILKKINPKWGPELLLDYPNGMSYEKFKERKQEGLIPKNAQIGDGIAIHATRPDEEWTIDNYYNWTDGCISLKYTEMKDLFSYIPVGTPVTIEQ